MTGGRLLTPGHSAAFLPEESALRRLPRAPQRRRPPEFLERYEDRALVYDAFWHVDGKRILLVGPPPMNLMPSIQAARYEAMPGRVVLTPRYFPSLSTMITELSGAPAGTTEIVMHLEGFDFLGILEFELSDLGSDESGKVRRNAKREANVSGQ